MKQRLFAITSIILTGLISACSSPQTEMRPVKISLPADYQWVQLGEEGAVVVRAIFKQSRQNSKSTPDFRCGFCFVHDIQLAAEAGSVLT